MSTPSQVILTYEEWKSDQNNIKQLNKKIDELNNHIQSLQNMNDSMQRRINLLEEQSVINSINRLNRIVNSFLSVKNTENIFLSVKAIRKSVFTNQGIYTIQRLESGEVLVKQE